jgi:hypothetical protein
MKTVKIKREELLAKVKENRAKHIEEFKEAHAGYLEEFISEVKMILREAKKGNVIQTIDIAKPSSFESNYDRIIAMLEWSTEETVDLDATEFEQYVRDNWQWKHAFNTVASLYNSKVG